MNVPLNEKRNSGDLSSPASEAFWCTPSDTVDCKDTRGIICNGDGVVRVTFVNNADDTYVDVSVLEGVVYPFRIKRVWETITDVGVLGLK